MEASKVTISQETLNSNVLSRKKKRELRIESVKSFIRNTVAGEKMDMVALMAAAGYNPKRQYQSGYQFITGLMKKRIVVKDDPKSINSTWSIPSDSRIIKPADTKMQVPIEEKISSSKNRYSLRIKVVKLGEPSDKDKFAIDEVITDIQLNNVPLNKVEQMTSFAIKNIEEVFEN